MTGLASTFLIAARLALGTLLRSPLRSFLVLQGVLWATVLGVLPASILRGSREAAIDRAAELGTDRILVAPDPSAEEDWDWGLVARLREELGRDARSVAAYSDQAPFLVTLAPRPEAADRVLVAGRWPAAEPLRSGDSLVCALHVDEAARRFPGREPLGERLELAGRSGSPEVVGLFRGRGERRADLDAFGFEIGHPLHGLVEKAMEYLGVNQQDLRWYGRPDRIVVPVGAVPGARPGLLHVRADPADISRVAGEVRATLVRAGHAPIIFVNPLVQILFSAPMATMETMHVVVFFVCLLAGVVIVSNLMILSVLRRRREVAIRRTEGATQASIAFQFMVETGTICAVGSLLGIPVAILLAWARTSLDPSGSLQWILPVGETLETVCLVCVFGMLGGVLPAVRAAGIDPVEVLSHE